MLDVASYLRLTWELCQSSYVTPGEEMNEHSLKMPNSSRKQ